ncbi:hypothetical protein FACS1894190_08480 [Spirochaetia bacterium]|nr:hypothetical protein FACS1894190_08480 [Spirochaetia bacterium]
MIKTKLHFLFSAAVVSFFVAVPTATAFAGGTQDGSEVLVQRVDNNSLIRLRVYIDARAAGTLRVGETSTYKIKNGPHTIRVAFEDYIARTTEVTQFTANNTRHLFTVTDESVVSVGTEAIHETSTMAVSTPMEEHSIDQSVRSSFEKATQPLKSKSRIAVVNVDSDNIHEGDFVLEELTYLSVDSKKKFQVIDRRQIDAFRAKNAIGVPSYENDFMLQSIGNLLGVDYVISGRLDGVGALRRLRVKALEVKTGKLVGDSSDRI